jgi:ankyrin repeat protein
MSDECGDMAMHEAACGGDVAEVQRLVAAGLDVDEPCASGLRPLHYAATNGHLETVKALVESGADKNALTIAGGATPLHLAADGGHVETVMALCHSGVDLFVQNARGETALQGSVRLGQHQVAEVLRELERTVRGSGTLGAPQSLWGGSDLTGAVWRGAHSSA